MPAVNPGPTVTANPNLQSPLSGRTLQTIAVNMTPPSVSNASAEQSYGLNGASYVTAATGLVPGDVIVAINSPTVTVGLGMGNFRVDPTTPDKFYISWINATAATLTPPAGYYLLTVARLNSSSTNTPQTFASLPNSLT